MTNIQIYDTIYGCISLGGYNLGSLYARQLNFSNLFTQTKTFSSIAPGSCPGVGLGSKCITDQIEHLENSEIYASRCCCHMGKEQRAGAFIYFGLMSSFTYFFQKTGFDISCKLLPLETVCMKCQVLFSGKK